LLALAVALERSSSFRQEKQTKNTRIKTPNKIASLENTVKKFIAIYFKDVGYLLKAQNKIFKEIKDKFKIKIENGKEDAEFENLKRISNILNYLNYLKNKKK
jgi:hypothetical protein